ncbi:helix-turn-helix domain-containing protein [Flavobacteriaceae bacterium S356]|uniref:Helix-turn-helix domain-containing protein n=1 Tax=Asprobacillus argus TaxID=3076534 RepID=A0ABU3LDU4_9FLAO|nr:helix-turn-helix domain-containing protein [Flavobacteriaceae bacterium S356]
MNTQILFFFSALGAFNGLFLSLYFAFFVKNKSRATYFLAGLLFVISVRVTKSVFLTFYPGTSSTFVHIGLTACFLIGPFLYIYTRVTTRPEKMGKWIWLIHIIPIVIFMIIIGYYYPYRQYSHLWWRLPPRIFGTILLIQWTAYVVAAIYQIRGTLKKLFSKTEKLSTLDFWLLNIVAGGFLIWLAYNTTMYTSYIVGALSFSFTFYITVIIWFLKRRKEALSFLSLPTKYGNRKISDDKVHSMKESLAVLFEQEAIYVNPDLKLLDVANALEVPSHSLSQYLNDNVGMSFSNFINQYRIAAAEEMLKSNNVLTLAAIGNECGFRSNSSFYAAFKKIKGVTPAQYKKSL